MNSKDVIVNIKKMEDINCICENTKYINVSIDNVDNHVIDYLLMNGGNYLYSDTINDKNGFIYCNFDVFKLGESIVDNIIDNMPLNLNNLEKVRYIYISLGKILCRDINVMNEKNEVISFGNISTINNIWSALSKHRVNDIVTSKIFMYVCSKLGIKCELINSNIKGNVANKVVLDDSFLIVDLFNDLHNIQGGFVTLYFDKYNDNKVIDKKIGYIIENYTNYYVEMVLQNVNHTDSNILYEILSLTGNVINVNNIGSYELFEIYRNIFDKYATGCDIRVNNLYVYNGFDTKDHFALFSHNECYYSFNYNKKCFVRIDMEVIYDNIKNMRIGIYDDEDFIINEKGMVL